MLLPLAHKNIFDIVTEVQVHTHNHTQHNTSVARTDSSPTAFPNNEPEDQKRLPPWRKKNLSHTKKLWNKTGHYRIKRRKKSPDFPPENVQQQTFQWYDIGRTVVPDLSRPAALLADRRPMASNCFLGRMHLTKQHTCNVLLHLAWVQEMQLLYHLVQLN